MKGAQSDYSPPWYIHSRINGNDWPASSQRGSKIQLEHPKDKKEKLPDIIIIFYVLHICLI